MATTRHLTILLTDIKGFSDKTSHKSRADIDAMLAEHRELVLPALEDRGGRLLKTIGDAFLMTFDSPTDAVLAGVAVQDALLRRNEGRVGEDRLEVRIAIHAGEVNISESDIFGEPVNITARIEGIAEAGEVFFTEAVYFAMNKAEVPSSEVGLFKLKGIEGEFRVYKVRRETPLSGTNGPPAAAVRAAAKVIEVGDPAPKAWRVPAPGAAGASAGPAPADPEGRRARRRVLFRRAVATALDVFICSIVAGGLAGKGGDDFARLPLVVSDAHAAQAPKKIVDGEDGAVALEGGKLRIKDKESGDEMAIGLGGLTVKEKGKTVVNMTLPEAAKTAARESAADEESDDERAPSRRRRRGNSRKDALFPFVWVALNMLALVSWGATLGKRALKFKVVRQGDGGTPDWKAYLLRTVLTFVSAAPMGLGYLWAYWDKDGRGWHDLWAGTRVVPDERSA